MDAEPESVGVLRRAGGAPWPTAQYDATYKTVRCAELRESCDSGSELRGRGQVAFEHYYPSTLGGSCPDGAGGTDRDAWDLEWVGAIRVSTPDQKHLAEGQKATIDVQVNLPPAPQNDFLDLYSAVNPSNPTWKLIATRQLAPGTTTVSVPYTVPKGSSGPQALRAALRRDGAASPCTTGPYDDRDDLVFQVGPPYTSGAKATRVSAAFDHALALREDGTVWGWGFNHDFQLGTFNQDHTDVPIQPAILSGVKSVHALKTASLVLRQDGTVWGWGLNSQGELGNGTTTSSRTPVQVSGLTNVIALATAAEGENAFALKSDGTVWAWGDNHYAQLGDGTTTTRLLPVQARGLSQVTALSTSGRHTLALKSDGTVWAWGENSGGCLGDGTFDPSFTPKAVKGLTGVRSVAAGRYYSLAIRNSRQLWAWGRGPLGDATNDYRTPTLTHQWTTGTFSVFASKAWSGYSSMAVDSTQGKLWAWGGGSNDSCETRAVPASATPVALSGLPGVVEADLNGYRVNLFRGTDGSVWSWISGACSFTQVALP